MAATSQTIIDGQRVVVVKLHNDGQTEANVLKVDVSGLAAQTQTGLSCSEVAIEQMWYSVTSDISVDLLWDATANVVAWSLVGDGHHDFRCVGPITNNSATGKTGDLLATTVGTVAATSRYSIVLALRKIYA
jgi:hypothetical protein